mmetsp:Transcript_4750/g.13294  ORF Transcript_4750/g.13294 Transcript_4750/m.13294 type:complete len:532 (-) Transcript_4750:58-1653(-)
MTSLIHTECPVDLTDPNLRISQVPRETPKDAHFLGGFSLSARTLSSEERALHYYHLHRPTTMPSIKRQERFKSDKGKSTFGKLANQDFTVAYIVQEVGNAPILVQNAFQKFGELTLYVLSGDSFLDTSHQTGRRLQGNNELVCACNIRCDNFGLGLGEEYESEFTATQQHLLQYRVLHRFYRTHASHLMGSIIKLIFLKLRHVYQQEEKWAELVDLALIFADACFQGPHDEDASDDMTWALVQLGEALELTGRFEDAARVYEDVIKGVATKTLTNSSNCPLHKAWDYAAVAWRRSGNLEKAQASYFRALKECYEQYGFRTSEGRRSCNVNGDQVSGIWSNLILSYEYASQASEGSEEEFMMFQSSGAVIFAMLKRSHYEPPQAAKWMFDSQSNVSSESLRPEVASSPSKAMQTLAGIIESSTSLEEFRVKLIKCVLPGRPVQLTTPLRSNDRNAKKAQRKFDKSEARNCTQTCSNMNCLKKASTEGVKLSTCPCKTVHYCSKRCQIEHWSEHKQFCSARADKRKNSGTQPA